MPAATGVTAVDTHAHVLRRDVPLAPERHSAPKRDVPVEEFLGVLDLHHISHAVLTAPSFYGTDNSILVDALRRYPQRLRGSVIVAPDCDDSTLDMLDDAGVIGIRLNWFRRDSLPDTTSREYRSLFDRVRARKWHIEVYLEGPKLAVELPRLRASGAIVVVDHFGAPDPQRGIACAGFRQVLAGVRAGDTYVKLSAPYRLGGADAQPYVDALLDANPQRLVWASDWPFVGFEEKVRYAQCVEWLHAWVPEERARRAILVDTPRRLFCFGS